jgi:hypothetical protein
LSVRLVKASAMPVRPSRVSKWSVGCVSIFFL